MMKDTIKVIDGKLEITRTHKILRTRSELEKERVLKLAQIDHLAHQRRQAKKELNILKARLEMLPEEEI